ncbi:MAG TPA: SDR family NAD(P)-dependent oxidoreductase [Thermoleophilaceae bacterium]|nr:SDR family NAD(P)-dependent oxidoreductase [Thermoleophilaceae bacterium]
MQIGPGTKVLVTGASRGIGEAIARAFAARGCTLGLVARSAHELEALAASLPGAGHMALPADVGDAQQVAAAIERFGALDVLVANAGMTHYMPFSRLSIEQAEQMTRVNWLGTVYSAKAALPGMLERHRGHIVVISSGAGLRSFPDAAVYGATKAAQRGFAEALRHELHGSGVSLTLVYPGEVESALHDHELDRMPDWYRLDRRSPAGPLATAVVEAVERDRRELFYPPNVRLLRVAHGIAPGLADALLRRILGRGAAPRGR